MTDLETYISVEVKSDVVDGVDVLCPPLRPRSGGIVLRVLRVLGEDARRQTLQLAARRRMGAQPEGLSRTVPLAILALLQLEGCLAVPSP